jgi:hypothetical protein
MELIFNEKTVLQSSAGGRGVSRPPKPSIFGKAKSFIGGLFRRK